MRQGKIIVRILFALMTTAAHAQRHAEVFYASPTGTDNAVCSEKQPCTPQSAVKACYANGAESCTVKLSDGIYINPEINIFYYRDINIEGNCKAPQNVVLRATKTEALIWIQDHAIGIVRCLALEATVPGATGIAGRQHIIADYNDLIFGPMLGGVDIAMSDFSIANCEGPNSITGGAYTYAAASGFSKLNMNCRMTLPQPLKFDYFVDASSSIINAINASFSGAGATESTGVRCTGDLSKVNSPKNGGFPGDSGRCRNKIDDISQVRAEIGEVGAKIERVRNDENVHVNRLIAAIVLLALISGGAGAIAYRRLANRKG